MIPCPQPAVLELALLVEHLMEHDVIEISWISFFEYAAYRYGVGLEVVCAECPDRVLSPHEIHLLDKPDKVSVIDPIEARFKHGIGFVFRHRQMEVLDEVVVDVHEHGSFADLEELTEKFLRDAYLYLARHAAVFL